MKFGLFKARQKKIIIFSFCFFTAALFELFFSQMKHPILANKCKPFFGLLDFVVNALLRFGDTGRDVKIASKIENIQKIVLS